MTTHVVVAGSVATAVLVLVPGRERGERQKSREGEKEGEMRRDGDK